MALIKVNNDCRKYLVGRMLNGEYFFEFVSTKMSVEEVQDNLRSFYRFQNSVAIMVVDVTDKDWEVVGII